MGYTIVHLDTLEAGIWFPLHSAVSRLFAKWDISQAQMHPNWWNILLVILTLFGLENCSAFLGMRELTALVQLVERQMEVDWYHVKATDRFKMVEEILSTLRLEEEVYLSRG